MKFMLLLWGDEAHWEGLSEEDMAADMVRWDDYTNQLVAAGALVSGEPLDSSTSSKLLTVKGGERVVTDGPYAETKEQLGGFYVIQCGTIEEALDWAAKAPSSDRGTTEVRPVPDYEAMAEGSEAAAGAQS
jgi:hypothetical protein